MKKVAREYASAEIANQQATADQEICKTLASTTKMQEAAKAEELAQAARPVHESEGRQPQARSHLRLIIHTPASTFESKEGARWISAGS